jgi:DNA-binding response OmpR family regulator
MKPTMLAGDDDAIVLDIYQAILEGAYNLHLTSSAEEAVEFLNSHPRVDLILLDIMMPKRDGYEVCRRIRAVFGSEGDLGLVVQFGKIGADDYMTKPFDASALLAKVKVFLRLKNGEEINKIKTNFINLLYQKTRTPLTAIFGYAASLRQSANLSLQEKYFVEH